MAVALRTIFRSWRSWVCHNKAYAEWCPSGRRSGPGKLVVGKTARGFESHLLRPRTFLLAVLHPTIEERNHRNSVFARILDHIHRDEKILLPAYNREEATASADFALLAIPENSFSGVIGEYKYQFEGEDDLLHVFVMRQDREPLTVPDAQQVVSFLLPEVSPALIWLRPGTLSHHFYVGHDELS